MQPQEPQGQHPLVKARQAAHIAFFVARVMATPLELCLRREFGKRYFGFATMASFAVVPMWIVWWPYHSPDGLLALWAAMFFMLVRARVETLRLAAKGRGGHTRYNGWPRLAKFFPRMPEAKVKALCEPAFGLIAGGLIYNLDAPLGSFLIISAFSLFLMQGIMESVEQARAEQLHDAFIDQQQLAARFRDLSGQ